MHLVHPSTIFWGILWRFHCSESHNFDSRSMQIPLFCCNTSLPMSKFLLFWWKNNKIAVPIFLVIFFVVVKTLIIDKTKCISKAKIRFAEFSQALNIIWKLTFRMQFKFLAQLKNMLFLTTVSTFKNLIWFSNNSVAYSSKPSKNKNQLKQDQMNLDLWPRENAMQSHWRP